MVATGSHRTRRAATALGAVLLVLLLLASVAMLDLAILYRFFFILLIDVAKLFATLEEFMNVRMTWGKLERVGRI